MPATGRGSPGLRSRGNGDPSHVALLHPAHGSSQKAAPAAQNSCQGLYKTERSGVPVPMATLVRLFQLGPRLDCAHCLGALCSLAFGRNSRKTTLPGQGRGVVFPDSRCESEGMHSWASAPGLGAGSFRRPQRRGTEQGSENVPRHPPANQSSPLTGTGDRGPGQLSFPPTCVTGSWPLREGGLRQTGNPGLATPWQPSSEPGPGVGGLEGTPRGTRGFIFQVPAWSHSGGSGPIRGCKGQCGVRAQYSSEQPSGAASLSPYAEAPEAQKGEATCLRPHSESGCLLHGAGTGPLGRSPHDPQCSLLGPGAGEPVGHRGRAGEGGPPAAGPAAGLRRRPAPPARAPRCPVALALLSPVQVLASRPGRCFQ